LPRPHMRESSILPCSPHTHTWRMSNAAKGHRLSSAGWTSFLPVMFGYFDFILITHCSPALPVTLLLSLPWNRFVLSRFSCRFRSFCPFFHLTITVSQLQSQQLLAFERRPLTDTGYWLLPSSSVQLGLVKASKP